MKEKIEKLIEKYTDKVVEAGECEKYWKFRPASNQKEQAMVLTNETFWGTKREYYEKFVLDLRSLLAD